MAKFDFVEAAAAGYQFVWRERRAILALSSIPLAVKIGSYAVILLFNLEGNFLRQGLVVVPAYFLEGFVVALAVRMAIFNENFNGLFNGRTQFTFPEAQRRAIMACAAIYSLTKLFSSFMSGSMMMAQQMEPPPGTNPSETATMTTTLMLGVFLMWAFRFFWLYVPAAMGVSIKEFLWTIRKFTSSIYLLGLWVVCSVPLTAIMLGCAQLLDLMLGKASPVYMVAMAFPQAVLELAIALVGGVAMAYIVRSIMSGGGKIPRLF